MNQQEMIYSIGLWLAKLLEDTNANKFTETLTNVTNKEGKKIGSFKLTFERV